MKEAGILHDTPEAAAAKVLEIYDDPNGWWRESRIQRARELFCRRFVRTSDTWVDEWKAELRRLTGEARVIKHSA